jgi:rhodanese-related sulfurtransferase
VVLLDLQSDIAYRIMGHIPGSMHVRPDDLDKKLSKLSKDKEIIVIDMFGSQGLAPAAELAKKGYKVGYLADGMMDWHISRDFPVEY